MDQELKLVKLKKVQSDDVKKQTRLEMRGGLWVGWGKEAEL
jgi:hypothetical protein